MGEGLLRAHSNWCHAVTVSLPVIGESNKIKNRKFSPRKSPSPPHNNPVSTIKEPSPSLGY